MDAMIEEAEAIIGRLESDDPLDLAYDPDFLHSVAGMMKRLVDGLKWRSVKDDPPPMDGTLVILHVALAEPEVSIGYYDGEVGWLIVECDIMPTKCNPTHWLPLPTPPKGEG